MQRFFNHRDTFWRSRGSQGHLDAVRIVKILVRWGGFVGGERIALISITMAGKGDPKIEWVALIAFDRENFDRYASRLGKYLPS